jgi:kynureninase
MVQNYSTDKSFALKMDKTDPLRSFRKSFHFPKNTGNTEGGNKIYFCGNSLGLQPKTTKKHIQNLLDNWQERAVEGHFTGAHPFADYPEALNEKMATIVGAKTHEVAVMNTLTVNLHLLMVSFYRPTKERYKILIDYNPFPSDRYAIASQLRYHGFDPQTAIVEPRPKPNSALIDTQDILQIIENEGDSIALILIGGINYYSGQLYDLAKITDAGHCKGCVVGFDLAHAAGNVPLQLHDIGCDFAAWCTYKYLNAGPGAIGAIFVHERHAHATLPRFEGWWGFEKATRFKMTPDFVPIGGAESWQMSTPPVLSMAAIKASLEIFEAAGFDNIVKKSRLLTGYLEFLLKNIPTDTIQIITPEEPTQRGCQLSIKVKGADKSLFYKLLDNGVVADWREPDVIRVAPAPLYNSFLDVYNFVEILRKLIG